MDRVEEIEAAIAGLQPDEYHRFSIWFHELDQIRLDERIDRDSAAGRLDFLFDEVDRGLQQGTLLDWPPQK